MNKTENQHSLKQTMQNSFPPIVSNTLLESLYAQVQAGERGAGEREATGALTRIPTTKKHL